MKTKTRLLLCAAAIIIYALTAAGEILADDDCPKVVSPCGLNQVTCGKRNCLNVCVNIFPTTADGPGGSCTFTWGVTNVGGTSNKPANVAVAYECTPGVNATGSESIACGAGISAVGNAFKNIFQLDSVKLGPFMTNVTNLSYTINASCAVRGPNDVAFKFGSSSAQSCNGAIEGFGSANVFAPSVATECVRLGENGSMLVTRGPNSCATGKVKVFGGNTNCTAPTFTEVDVTATIAGFRYSQPLNQNVKCGEFLRITENSPVRFTYESGGLVYEFCYDDETGDVLSC